MTVFRISTRVSDMDTGKYLCCVTVMAQPADSRGTHGEAETRILSSRELADATRSEMVRAVVDRIRKRGDRATAAAAFRICAQVRQVDPGHYLCSILASPVTPGGCDTHEEAEARLLSSWELADAAREAMVETMVNRIRKRGDAATVLDEG